MLFQLFFQFLLIFAGVSIYFCHVIINLNCKSKLTRKQEWQKGKETKLKVIQRKERN